MPRTVEIGSVPFAVVDVETTGLSPWLNDRVVEIAVVRVKPGVGISDEYATLINPERDIGPTHIHGIGAADVKDAPPFRDVAGDIGARLADAVFVAHNARFDGGFLAAEFQRVGVSMPLVPTVCTLALGRLIRPGLSRRRLADCCEDAGVEFDDAAHMALHDARATAHLLAAYLTTAQESGCCTASGIGCKPDSMPDPWCGLAPSGRKVSRDESRARVAEERTYLARLVEKLPPTPFDDPDEGCYLELLDRALEDRRITGQEADVLFRTAADWGLTRAKVFEAHHAYLAALVKVALADSVVTDSERKDLEDVCSLLGLHRSALDALLPARVGGGKMVPSTTINPVELVVPPLGVDSSLRGLTVCFTGEMTDTIGGERIDRDLAARLAVAAGLIVKPSVTKKLGLLVVADAESASGKARRARELGIRVMAPPVFWRAIGVKVD
jgi:DNA polymerase III epsilon subunit family exonuclease